MRRSEPIAIQGRIAPVVIAYLVLFLILPRFPPGPSTTHPGTVDFRTHGCRKSCDGREENGGESAATRPRVGAVRADRGIAAQIPVRLAAIRRRRGGRWPGGPRRGRTAARA